MATQHDFLIPQGEDHAVLFRAVDGSGNAIDCTGATWACEVRDGPDGTVIFDYGTGNPMEESGSVAGEWYARLALTNAETSNLANTNGAKSWRFDVEVTFSDGEKKRLVFGNCGTTAEITEI